MDSVPYLFIIVLTTMCCCYLINLVIRKANK
jgi:hypothetical protein